MFWPDSASHLMRLGNERTYKVTTGKHDAMFAWLVRTSMRGRRHAEQRKMGRT